MSYSEENVSCYQIWNYCDTMEEVDYLYGGEDYILNDKDIEHLMNGGIINFSVNAEYGCTLRYEKEDRDD